MVTTKPQADRGKPELLVGTYHKLVTLNVVEQQCNTVRTLQKNRIFLQAYMGLIELSLIRDILELWLLKLCQSI